MGHIIDPRMLGASVSNEETDSTTDPRILDMFAAKEGMQFSNPHTVNGFKINAMPAFPPDANPFHHDAYHMGTYFGGANDNDNEWCAMYSGSRRDRDSYIILIHRPTGRRIRIAINNEEK